MKDICLSPNLHLLPGAVNTGVLLASDKALLIDCCDSVTFERLQGLGVRWVEMILCTQYRRVHCAGIYPFAEQDAQIVVPAGERPLFEDLDAFWSAARTRWHIYSFRPGVEVLPAPVEVSRAVQDGDVIEWEGFSIRVIETPGMTDGGVSYVVEQGGDSFCFCGDVICGDGKLPNLHSLQRGGGISDYHGFLGARPLLLESLDKIANSGPETLVPSHGEPISNPSAAIQNLKTRLNEAWLSYSSISATNYFAVMFGGAFDAVPEIANDPRYLKPGEAHQIPDFIREAGYTSKYVLSDSGSAFLVDCGHISAIDTVGKHLSDRTIKNLDFCWVTHYHDDHVDSLMDLHLQRNCPVYTEEHMTEILEHPIRFFLPCISPNAVPVARRFRDGESWQWHEFRLTAYHFPGQTFYHSGLLLEGHGTSVFFAGDSFFPNGIDDYCSANRNFLGAGRGHRRCIEILRKHKPEHIVIAHFGKAFRLTDEILAHMDRVLAERESIYGDLLPWPHPNFGTDLHWVRTYPYQQEVARGATFAVDIQFTNHGPAPKSARAEPVLPHDWEWDKQRSPAQVTVPAQTDGSVEGFCVNPDKSVRLWISIPEDARQGCCVVPIRIHWGDLYLGQAVHALVNVR